VKRGGQPRDDPAEIDSTTALSGREESLKASPSSLPKPRRERIVDGEPSREQTERARKKKRSPSKSAFLRFSPR
jgi:hypothetical protein